METDTERLVREAREVYALASEPTHMGTRDLRSMLASIELQARILGAIGGTGGAVSVQDLKRAAQAAGLEVRPKLVAAR